MNAEKWRTLDVYSGLYRRRSPARLLLGHILNNIDRRPADLLAVCDELQGKASTLNALYLIK